MEERPIRGRPFSYYAITGRDDGCNWTVPASLLEPAQLTANIVCSESDRASDGNVERIWRRAGGTIEWFQKNSCVAGVPPAGAVEIG